MRAQPRWCRPRRPRVGWCAEAASLNAAAGDTILVAGGVHMGTFGSGRLEIARNTILFTWSRLEDFQDMGYGIRLMTKMRTDIHDNIIGGNILGGVEHRRFTKDEWIKLDDNIFFVN
jgi:hypothetical protein